MKVFSKAMITSLILAAISLMPMNQANAQSVAEPAVVVSVAKVAEQLDDIGYLAEASGFGQMSFLIKMQAEQFLKGVDTSKPAGIMMFFREDSETPDALAFFPVSNLDDVLNTISQQAEVDEGDDFTTIIPDEGDELYLREVGGYAFVSDKQEMFDAIPSSPESVLGDLPTQYNLGAKVFAQRIPESLRDQALQMVEEGYTESMEEMGDFPAELQEKNFEMQMATIKSLINETEELVVGFAADEEGGNLHLDFQITGLEGSKLAEQSAASNNIDPTRFAGFLMDGAAFTANACSELNEEDIAQYQDMVGQLRDEAYKELEDSDMSEEEFEIIRSIADDLFEVVEDTLKEGRIDLGAVVTTNEKLEFAVGFQVADAGKLEDSFRDLIKMAENEPQFQEAVELKLNSGKINGVQLHEMIVQIPQNEEEMVDVLGEEMTLIIGIDDKQVYLAGGSKDPKGLLEKAMSGEAGDSASTNMTMQYNLFLAPILRMASSIEGEEMMEQMAEMLEASGSDRVQISASIIENGMKGQLQIQDGLLELIGVATQAMGGMMGGGGADF